MEKALYGEPSPFYGLDSLSAKMPQVKQLWHIIDANQQPWLDLVQATLSRLLPEEDLNHITIYPIIGYDMGIGLENMVCMNLNGEPYFAEPDEFLYFIIHECVHVIYEWHHTVPPLRNVVTADQWLSYLKLWVQNEGYAVYAPLQLRQEHDHLGYLPQKLHQ